MQAVIAKIAHAILIRIGLGGINEVGTIVASITDAVMVPIGLIGIDDKAAILIAMKRNSRRARNLASLMRIGEPVVHAIAISVVIAGIAWLML